MKFQPEVHSPMRYRPVSLVHTAFRLPRPTCLKVPQSGHGAAAWEIKDEAGSVEAPHGLHEFTSQDDIRQFGINE